MLYLLDGTEFEHAKDYAGKTRDSYAKFNMSDIIYRKLELAAKTNELVHTQWLRGIGKTYELVMFAKLNGYAVIEPDALNADMIRRRETYGNILYPSCYSYEGSLIRNLVIDEGVSVYQIQELVDAGFTIITGFITPKKDTEKTFDESVTDTLKNEIEALTPKIQKARNKDEIGTYKNLILAYKEVLFLIHNAQNQTMKQ